MSEAIFGSGFIRATGSGEESLSLTCPRNVYSTCDAREVKPLLESAEAAAKSGAWVAVMLSYESAPAFDENLIVQNSGSFPLAWAAVFPECRFVENPQAYPGNHIKPQRWTSSVEVQEFTRNVKLIHKLIAAGETYQVNYTFPLIAHFTGDPVQWFHHLYAAQRSPYCCYLDLGGYKVLSLSPELFLERTGTSVITRPMKGTIRRGRWLEEDHQLRAQLSHSEKDRAENVMIVDLLRNDFGKIALTGSVEVSELFKIEDYETIHQMTSTVTARLPPRTSLVELITATFPCGSVTGAPKIRTMSIIRELERSARCVYTGTIGLLRPGGDYVFNVAIRTVLIDCESHLATFGVGAGITIGSVPEAEYEECLLKASFLNHQEPAFKLFESIRLEEGTYYLLDAHLARMKSSARYFNFIWPEKDIRLTLQELAKKHQRGLFKVRLLLSKQGDLESEVVAVDSIGKQPLRVAIANAPCSSEDRFLYHKTTKREFYDATRAARSDCDDVIFWNENGEITESSVANVVVEIKGELVTPPRTSGLLAGTFRERLIEEGRLREQAITGDDLKRARNFFLINSVRKWMTATLVD